MAVIDMLGVASILPFMAVLMNPEIIETNSILNKIYEYTIIFGVESNEQFLFFLGIFVFLLLIISLAFKALTNYAQIRFILMREYFISKRLVEGYLNQPYSWFLNRNSAELGKTVLADIGAVTHKGLAPILTLTTQSIIAVALLILLILVDTWLTLIVFFLFGTIYLLIYSFNKRLVNRIGKELFEADTKRFSTLIEAFGASKEVKIGGLEQIFVDRFSSPAKIRALNSSLIAIINQLPRFILEAIAFGGMILIVLYLMSQSSDIKNVIPLISLFAFAGYRLMPALQQVYVSLTQLRIVGPQINNVYNDLIGLKKDIIKKNQQYMSLKKKISLENIFYQYPQSTKTTLRDINLNIHAQTTVALVGETGSGKTTTVDIILGLLEPEKGILKIDNEIITKENQKSWQNIIGYVPQQIFLTDNSIAANIAFGVEAENIDYEAVEKAAKIANLHEFIIDELPKKYLTTVGERGIRLSGGQRQRIGIARALYRKPQLLILDEATNSLDNLTEKAVMDAVYNLKKNITIILIAHRLSTVKNCDKIFLFNKGKLIEEGTFNELIKKDSNFRAATKNLY
tara:strand:+ start:11934 stop:13646 length:1713 start_codon:yes stop_codon:yes gene_type:complete